MQNELSTEELAMPTKEGTLPKFAVGSRIRVRKGVTAPNYPGVPLSGWLGTVSQMSGALCLVCWSDETVAAIAPVHREQWQRDGVDSHAMWLHEKALEAGHVAPLCLERERHVGAA
jgi:hypothetical protein